MSVDEARLCEDWPGSSAAVVMRLDGGAVVEVAHCGDVAARRPWASVSKLVVAMAVGIDVDDGRCRYEQEVDLTGATLAHLLSHSGGFGLEATDRTVPVGTRRVYSNVAVDRAVDAVADGVEPSRWLGERVFEPLAMATSELVGRPSAGVAGSTRDLATFVGSWLKTDLLSPSTRERILSPFLGDLDGIVPGFGAFRPCPWGLGPEIRGSKHHWMGDWPSDSAGHFGQSGALALFNVREGIAVVATTTTPFGSWAVALWPEWTSFVRRLASAS